MPDSDFTNPIIITGCARSGTSLTAGVLYHCGAWVGGLGEGNANNPKGFFENLDIRNKITKPFLKSINADPLGQKPLPDIELIKRIVNDDSGVFVKYRSSILNIVKSQGCDFGSPWFIKEAKACLIWPLINKAFPESKWIVVRRVDSDIINSCMRTNFMRRRKSREDWQLWVDHHKKQFVEMELAGLNVIEVWPEEAVRGDLTGAENMIKFCGLEWDEVKVKGFIEPKYWKRGVEV